MEYPFPCGEKKIWSNIKGSQKIIKMVVCVSIFLSLLTAPNIKNSHFKARIFFIFLKIVLTQIQILTARFNLSGLLENQF